MSHEDLAGADRSLVKGACWAVFGLTVIYLVALVLGLISLKSPNDPIGDPYFTVLELLIVLMAPFMVVGMIGVHIYAAPEVKVYSLAALVFMVLLAGITSSVHFVILTVGRQIGAAGIPGTPLFLSFTWPSVVYALDILAWDFFFALAMLLAAPVFTGDGLERAVHVTMIAAGVLSLLGLAGVPLANMNVRNIGILGYAIAGPVAFLLMGVVLGRSGQRR